MSNISNRYKLTWKNPVSGWHDAGIQRNHSMKMENTRSGLWRFTAACAAAIIAVASAHAAEEAVQQDCRVIEDDAQRLACYDSQALPPKAAEAPLPADPANTPQPAESVAAPPQVETAEPEVVPQAAQPEEAPVEQTVPAAAAPAATEAPARLDDEVGKESLGRDKQDEVFVHGTVVKCIEDATGKYLFYFDNGQIWKQKDNTIIRWKECAFDVTISKDFFGYKMIPAGETRKVRIGRVR